MYALMQIDHGSNYNLYFDQLIHRVTHGGFMRPKIVCDFVAYIDICIATIAKDNLHKDIRRYISAHSPLDFAINPFYHFTSIAAKKLCADICPERLAELQRGFVY